MKASNDMNASAIEIGSWVVLVNDSSEPEQVTEFKAIYSGTMLRTTSNFGRDSTHWFHDRVVKTVEQS